MDDKFQEIEIQGVGKFQVPADYTPDQVGAHIRKLRLEKPEIFGSAPSAKEQTIARLKEGIRQSEGAEYRMNPVSSAEIFNSRPGASPAMSTIRELVMPTVDVAGDLLSSYKPRDFKTPPTAGDLLPGKDLREKIGNLAGARPAESDAAAARGSQAGVIGNAIPGVITALIAGKVGKAGVNQVVPSSERAVVNFQKVAAKADPLPVNTTVAERAAMRSKEIYDRGGGSMPPPIKKFLSRVRDPEAPPLTFAEARDFFSNAGEKMARKEYDSMSPKQQRQLGEFKRGLDIGIRDAAEVVGEGQTYGKAMREYNRASKIRNFGQVFTDALKSTSVRKAAAYGAATGLGVAVANKVTK